jgi:hypothetical protein
MKTWQTLLIGFLALLTTQLRAQSVGIGTATPHPSARLHVEDDERGILIPRLTTAQRNAIVGPARGLIIYNIDCDEIEYYDGTRWRSTQMDRDKQIFYFQGRTVQRVRVPCGVSQARIKVWGAGGGGGGWDVCGGNFTGGNGGGGAFATALVNVTPGHELEVYVGEGGEPGTLYGARNSAEGAAFGRGGWGYGSGGRGGAGGPRRVSGGGGGGGGSSAVFNRTTNTLIIAAGGGGGGGGKGDRNPCQGGAGGAGGATGQNGAASSGAGGLGGGSATRDGTAGGDKVGGDGAGGGGGGGGATNGGAGGGAATCDCGGGGGGGGNSFVPAGGTIIGGNLTTPGGTTDPDYLPGIGVGGLGAGAPGAPGNLALPGGNGLVVIEWIR